MGALSFLWKKENSGKKQVQAKAINTVQMIAIHLPTSLNPSDGFPVTVLIYMSFPHPRALAKLYE